MQHLSSSVGWQLRFDGVVVVWWQWGGSVMGVGWQCGSSVGGSVVAVLVADAGKQAIRWVGGGWVKWSP